MDGHSVAPNPTTASMVDSLAKLRADLAALDTRERALTAEIIRAIQCDGSRTLDGIDHVAVLDYRTTSTVDPELFFDALGRSALTGMSVSVTAARKLLSGSDLDAISETRTAPVLRVIAMPADRECEYPGGCDHRGEIRSPAGETFCATHARDLYRADQS